MRVVRLDFSLTLAPSTLLRAGLSREGEREIDDEGSNNYFRSRLTINKTFDLFLRLRVPHFYPDNCSYGLMRGDRTSY